jgi:plastocyanin
VKRLPFLFIVVGFLGAPRIFLAQATIEGRVSLPESSAAPVMTKRYEIVTKGGVLATRPPLGVVYLEGAFDSNAPIPKRQVAQKDLAFLPALLAIQTGSAVEFPNQDDTYHNIFSYSPTKRFDLGRYRSDERPIPSVTFDKPGLITLRCDIHEHMRGLILVVDSSHFTITERNGHFRLTNLPSGRFTLKAWIDSRTTRAQSVEVTNGSVLHVDFP